MNEGYTNFFVVLEDVLTATGCTIQLHGPQFEEICKIKNTEEFESAKGRRARLALTRIERFQKKNILSIRPMRIEPNRSSYADPLILQLLICAGKKGKSVCFITDDKELRIRARELFRRMSLSNAVIIEINELWPLLDRYTAAIRRERV